MPQAHIIGTGSAVPERIITNKDIESFVDTDEKWIVRRTGIHERHIATKGKEESTSNLAATASMRAMEMAGVSPDEIDTIIVATVSADRNFPSTACFVQEKICARNAASFDVGAACAGFLYALATGYNAIKGGMSKTSLVIGAERLSSIINWQDRTTCVIMADGAGAAVLSAQQDSDSGIQSMYLKSDGTLWELLYTTRGNRYIPEILSGMELSESYMKMNGNRLFKKAIESMSISAKKAFEATGLSGKDISLVIPHQANIRIIHALAKDLNIPVEKIYTNIHKYGNTSSASIPIAMDEANREGRLKKGDNVLLVAFGAGLTWGSSIVKWS